MNDIEKNNAPNSNSEYFLQDMPFHIVGVVVTKIRDANILSKTSKRKINVHFPMHHPHMLSGPPRPSAPVCPSLKNKGMLCFQTHHTQTHEIYAVFLLLHFC
ncbi:hypothetical protein PPYR_07921 [Photinus pyralis]|uniref:Uncharacterized protein n=1 Tax=Photinus pyralis TaxID=7054 RepID=A0A5N4ART7_PHOPY|nr:hypothetical protein PPYR_07921 [Photinus pyralis]